MKARILSAVLAILMILAVCPVISLSAADSNVSVWDGTVPGTEGKTLKELQVAFHAGSYTAPSIKVEDINSHFDYNATSDTAETVDSSWEIKTAGGLAFFSAWVNGYVNLSVKDASSGGYVTKVFTYIWNRTITLTTDIDLNNHPWIPIGAYATEKGKTLTFTFDGAGHYIRNMNITETAVKSSTTAKDYRYFGLFGRLPLGGDVTLKNLAILDATIDVTATTGGATLVGGLVGHVEGAKGFTVDNCIVDANIKLTTANTSTALQTHGDTTTGYSAFVGGIIGLFSNLTTLKLQQFLVNGNIEIEKLVPTAKKVATGGVIAASNSKALPTTEDSKGNGYLKGGLLNVTITGETTTNDEVPYFGLTNVGGIENVRGFGENIEQIINGTTVVTPWSDTEILDAGTFSSYGWVHLQQGRFPIPGPFKDKYDVIERCLYDPLRPYIMGASVRTQSGTPGLRFSVEIPKALLDKGVVEYGLLIIPKDTFVNKDKLTDLTVETTNALKIVVDEKGIYDNNETNVQKKYVHPDNWIYGTDSQQMNVALVGIPDNNLGSNLHVCAYVKLSENEYVYSYITTRNLKAVIENVMSSDSTEDKTNVYEAYKDKKDLLGDKFKAYAATQEPAA